MKKFLYGFLVCVALAGFTVCAQDAVDAPIPDASVVPEAVSVVEPAAAADVVEPAANVVEPVSVVAVQPAVPLVNTTIVQGTISEVATDGTYVVINDGASLVTFLTTKEFIDEAYMEVGDKVKVTGEKTADGLKLLDYDYIFDDTFEPVAEAEGDETVQPVVDAPVVETPLADTLDVALPAEETVVGADDTAADTGVVAE